MALAMTGDRLSAEDAERWGLIWKCVDDSELKEFSEKLSSTLAAGPTRALGLIKKAIYASAGNSLAAQLDLERDLQREVGKGKDYREGVAAFKEKRKPSFTGQ
jgi:2-(1,2-epoxy-1,2-dihydrophenyl)acetyl-CoA isomerase